jgi:uncharacterized membrane protein YcaP (DUF421 family)
VLHVGGVAVPLDTAYKAGQVATVLDHSGATSGKRTLSKFNAFDFLVTVALGSTLATVLISQQVSLAQGVTAFSVLLALQFAITWLSVRSKRVRELVKSEPALLFHRGQFLGGAMRRERVTEEELLAAMRAEGIASPASVFAAVLETDGTITVVRNSTDGETAGMRTVAGYPPEPS